MNNLFLSFLFIVLLGINCTNTNESQNSDEQEHLSTVEFSNKTSGGLGGDVIKVTNLNASGDGSLKAAIETEGARVIAFEVSGVIDLDKNKLVIKNPFITIAGQTAPSPGITIIKGGISIITHDVVIEHICVRPGDAGQPKGSGWEPDAISTYGGDAYNVVVDHCSLTWAVDESLSASGPRLLGPEHTSHHITFSNNIIAEALANSSHSEGEHSKGSLIHDNCRDIAIIGNLYANNGDRNPYFKASTTGIIVNNLIYDPGTAAIRLGSVPQEWKDSKIQPENPRVSIVGNVLYLGNNSRPNLPLVKKEGDAYMKDNVAYTPNMQKAKLAEAGIILLDEKPVWMKGVMVMPSENVVRSIIQHVGARPKERDQIDQRIIQDFIDKKGKILDSQEEVGGYPKYKPTYRRLAIPDDNIQGWLDKMAKALE